MANRWKGNIIAAAATTSSGTDYTGKANGAWGLNSQLQQKQGGLWAKGQTVPNAPTGVIAVKGNAQAIVSFTPPSETGGSAITSYTVTSSTGGITATGSASPITITGLTNGTAYTFTVTATNAVGTSTTSSSSNSTTPSADPTVIGEVYGGGFYAGKISTTGDGVATHYLIVSPKASGEGYPKAFGPYDSINTPTSNIDGLANTASLAALGANYVAAVFCKNLTIGGYTDWYLPARNELEVLYYNLKPSTTANLTTPASGSNVNAVSPEPISTNYTSGSPAQTAAGISFRTGETNAFSTIEYWSSTTTNEYNSYYQIFSNGKQGNYDKTYALSVRAVRRVPV